MNKKIAVGIDIGTYHIKVVMAELIREGDKNVPRIIGRGMSESKGMRHGYIINQPEISRSLKEAILQTERSSGIKIKKAYVSVGGISLEGITSIGSTLITRNDMEITEADVQKAIDSSENNLQLLNKTIIHTIPTQFKIDDRILLGRPVGIKGKKLEVKTLFITYLKQHLNDLIQAVEEAGIEIEDIIAAPIASSLVMLTKSQKIAGCILANLGSETVSVIVHENNIPISLEVFPIGSTNITNDIALGLKVPLEEAEKIKTGALSTTAYPKKKLDEIITARLIDIFELIDAHLKKIKRNELLPAGIILTGGGSGVTTIEDLAKACLKLPSKVGKINFINPATKMKDSTWSVAYGLCVFGLTTGSESKKSEIFSALKGKVMNLLKQLSV